jgi:hypothetical protein
MVCWIIRWFIACRVDTKTAPGPRLDEHLHACAGCRAYYQAHLRVSDLLETQTPPVTLESGESLKDTILGSLAASDSVSCSAHSLGNRAILSIAAAVFLVFSVTLAGMHLVAQRNARIREQRSVLASVMTLPERLAPGQLLAHYGPFMQSPLESEIQNLSMDAQNAALFVVQCTPFARNSIDN